MAESNNPLKKSAKTVQDALAAKGLNFKVIELSASTRTAAEAAEAIGCTVAQIMKSLVFCTQATHKPILVLASGINRVNEKIIETYLGEPVARADADFVREVTGFAIGGIPPIGHKQAVDTFIDQDLFNFEELWAAAGTSHAVFSLQPQELYNIIPNGKVITVC